MIQGYDSEEERVISMYAIKRELELYVRDELYIVDNHVR